jgi:hypothetical protein
MAKKAARRRPPKPFNPLAPQYKSQKGFNKAVRVQAKQQIAPGLQDIKQRQTEASGAHTTRNQELMGWYGNQQTGLQAAQDRLQGAMQGLLQTSGLEFQGGTDALAGALRKSQDANAAEAAKLGGVAPNQNEDYLKASAAYGTADQAGLLGDIAGGIGRSAANLGIGGIAGRTAGENEQRRYQTINDELTNERSALRAQLPGIQSQVRSQLSSNELARAGQAFQQNLARDQFGLDTAQFGETKHMNAFQRKLARRQQRETERGARVQEGQNEQQIRNQAAVDVAQVNNQRAQIQADIRNASTKQEQDMAKARADRFNNGVDILSNFLDPKAYIKGGKLNNKAYENSIKGRFGEVYHRIQAVTGMSEHEALLVMRTAANPGWAKHANDLLRKLKNKKTAQKVKSHTHPLKPGSRPTPPNKLPGLSGSFPG